jgi:hypothetical protein
MNGAKEERMIVVVHKSKRDLDVILASFVHVLVGDESTCPMAA